MLLVYPGRRPEDHISLETRWALRANPTGELFLETGFHQYPHAQSRNAVFAVEMRFLDADGGGILASMCCLLDGQAGEVRMQADPEALDPGSTALVAGLQPQQVRGWRLECTAGGTCCELLTSRHGTFPVRMELDISRLHGELRFTWQARRLPGPKGFLEFSGFCASRDGFVNS